MSRQKQVDEFADTQVLDSAQGATPAVPNLDWYRNRQEPAERTEAEAEALYQEYVRACEEAGLTPNPPYRKR